MDWPTVAAACAAWALDDGRPPAALVAATRYAAAPSPAARAALEAALVGAREAWLGALAAETRALHRGVEPGPVARRRTRRSLS